MTQSSLPEAMREKLTENGGELSTIDRTILARFDFTALLENGHNDLDTLKAKISESDDNQGVEFELNAPDFDSSLDLISGREKLSQESQKWAYNLYLAVADLLPSVDAENFEQQKNKLINNPGVFQETEEINRFPNEKKALALLVEVLNASEHMASSHLKKYWPVLVESVADMLRKLQETAEADAGTLAVADTVSIEAAVTQPYLPEIEGDKNNGGGTRSLNAASENDAGAETYSSEVSQEKWMWGERIFATDTNPYENIHLDFDTVPGLQPEELSGLAVNVGRLISRVLRENSYISDFVFLQNLNTYRETYPEFNETIGYLQQIFGEKADTPLGEYVRERFDDYYALVKDITFEIERGKDDPNFMERSINYLGEHVNEIRYHPEGIAQGVVDKGAEIGGDIWDFVKKNNRKLLVTAAVVGGTVMLSKWLFGDKEEAAGSAEKSGGFWKGLLKFGGLSSLSLLGGHLISRLWGKKSIADWIAEQIGNVKDKVAEKVLEQAKEPIIKALAVVMGEEAARKYVDELFAAEEEKQGEEKSANENENEGVAEKAAAGAEKAKSAFRKWWEGENGDGGKRKEWASRMRGDGSSEMRNSIANTLETYDIDEHETEILTAGGTAFTLFAIRALRKGRFKTAVGLSVPAVFLSWLLGREILSKESGLPEAEVAEIAGELTPLNNEEVKSCFREKKESLVRIYKEEGVLRGDEGFVDLPPEIQQMVSTEKMQEMWDACVEKYGNSDSKILEQLMLGGSKTLAFALLAMTIAAALPLLRRPRTILKWMKFAGYSALAYAGFQGAKWIENLIYGTQQFAGQFDQEFQSHVVKKLEHSTLQTLLPDYDSVRETLLAFDYDLPNMLVEGEDIKVVRTNLSRLEDELAGVSKNKADFDKVLGTIREMIDAQNSGDLSPVLLSETDFRRLALAAKENGYEIKTEYDEEDNSYTLSIAGITFAGFVQNPLAGLEAEFPEENFETAREIKNRMTVMLLDGLENIRSNIYKYITEREGRTAEQEQEIVDTFDGVIAKIKAGSYDSFTTEDVNELRAAAEQAGFQLKTDNNNMVMWLDLVDADSTFEFQKKFAGILPGISAEQFLAQEKYLGEHWPEALANGYLDSMDNVVANTMRDMEKHAKPGTPLMEVIRDMKTAPKNMHDSFFLARFLLAVARSEDEDIGATLSNNALTLYYAGKNQVFEMFGSTIQGAREIFGNESGTLESGIREAAMPMTVLTVGKGAKALHHYFGSQKGKHKWTRRITGPLKFVLHDAPTAPFKVLGKTSRIVQNPVEWLSLRTKNFTDRHEAQIFRKNWGAIERRYVALEREMAYWERNKSGVRTPLKVAEAKAVAIKRAQNSLIERLSSSMTNIDAGAYLKNLTDSDDWVKRIRSGQNPFEFSIRGSGRIAKKAAAVAKKGVEHLDDGLRNLADRLRTAGIDVQDVRALKPALKVLGPALTFILAKEIAESDNPNETAINIASNMAVFSAGMKTGSLALRAVRATPSVWGKVIAGLAVGTVATVVSEEQIRSAVERIDLETSDDAKNAWKLVAFATGGFALDPAIAYLSKGDTPAEFLENGFDYPVFAERTPEERKKLNASLGMGARGNLPSPKIEMKKYLIRDVADWNEYVAENKESKISEARKQLESAQRQKMLAVGPHGNEEKVEQAQQLITEAEGRLAILETEMVPINEQWDRRQAAKLALANVGVETQRESILNEARGLDTFLAELEKTVLEDGKTYKDTPRYSDAVEQLGEGGDDVIRDFVAACVNVHRQKEFLAQIGRYDEKKFNNSAFYEDELIALVTGKKQSDHNSAPEKPVDQAA